MNDIVEDRAVELAKYMIDNNATVRSTASKFGISKSTVHKDITIRLHKINIILYHQVQNILEKNKMQRHIRGGNATKLKYLALKQKT